MYNKSVFCTKMQNIVDTTKKLRPDLIFFDLNIKKELCLLFRRR